MKLQNPPWHKLYHGTLSLCIINKDQGKLLDRCLTHHKPLLSEIILVDTGSTDTSLNIATRHGAKIIHDPWQDDYARPRNIAIDAATSDWILILDPDELIAVKHFSALLKLTTVLSIAAFQLTTRNYAYQQHTPNYQINPKDCPEAKDYPGYHPSTKTRLFQRRYNLHFHKCWHELIDYEVEERNLPKAHAPIPIHHYPDEYQQKDLITKQLDYLNMGEKKVTENPNDAQAWWELSVAEQIIGYRPRAITSMEKSFSLQPPNTERLVAYYRTLKLQNEPDRARYAFEKALCLMFPNLTHTEPQLKPPIIPLAHKPQLQPIRPEELSTPPLLQPPQPRN